MNILNLVLVLVAIYLIILIVDKLSGPIAICGILIICAAVAVWLLKFIKLGLMWVASKHSAFIYSLTGFKVYFPWWLLGIFIAALSIPTIYIAYGSRTWRFRGL